MISKILRRLDGWKKIFLSLGHRITLIRSYLSHVSNCIFFEIPTLVALKIEKLQSDFFGWGLERAKRSSYQLGSSVSV